MKSKLATYVFISSLLANSVPAQAWMSAGVGEIQRIDMGERDGKIIVQVGGSKIGEYYSFLNRDGRGVTQKLFLSFYNARLSSKVEKMRSGQGSVLRIE